MLNTDNLLTLPDGRKLTYAEFGHSDGCPVLYFHGTPSSRLEPLMIGDEAFRQVGLRVIAPDRPGVGESDFQPNRGFSDWPKDVVFLTEALDLNQFSVLGVSGGGGFAAVCAAKIPEKLSKVVIASGAWRIDSEAIKSIGFPMNLLWQATTHAPILLPTILKMMRKMMAQPSRGGSEGDSAPPNKIMPAADHVAMAQPGRIDIFQRSLSEALKQGSKGTAWDMRLYVREWDFDPAEIQITLTMFHGEQDRNFPLALVQRAAKSLPGGELLTYPEDGHVSTYVNHFDEIARALMPD